MTAGRYVEAVALVLVTIGGLALTAVCLRRALGSSLSGAAARLAEVVIAIAILVLVSEALGTIGLFRAVPLVSVIAAISLAAFGLTKSRWVPIATGHGNRSAVDTRAREEAWWEPVVGILAVAIVIAEWAPATIHALRHGLSGTDTYWYHMPISAQFAQSGSVVPLHNINNDNTIAFYPATSELLHAVGILLVGSDVLSPLLTVFWLLLALFAAWCLGSRYGVGSLSVAATSMVLGTGEMVRGQPGSAYNDTAGIALLLAALGLLAHVDGLWETGRSLQSLWVPALSAGLAAGVKDTFIVPVVAITLGVLVLVPRGRRMRWGSWWCVIIVGAGGYWYVRNALDADNPFPNIHLGVGPIRLPTSPGAIGPKLWQFLFDGSAWRTYFLPGLHQALGSAWWAVIAIVILGLGGGAIVVARWLTGLISRPVSKDPAGEAKPRLRADEAMAALVSFVGLATVVGYLLTPQPNLPRSFVYDFRFSYFALLCGTIALPILLARWRWVSLLLPAYGVVICGTQFTRGVWFGTTSDPHLLAEGLFVGLTVVGLGLAFVVVSRRGRRGPLLRPGLALAVVVLVVAIGAGLPMENFYLDNWGMQAQYPGLARWASTVQGARIGITKGLILSYELYGSHLNNQVAFLGIAGPNGKYFDIDTCRAWRAAINAAKLGYVVTIDDLSRPVPSSVSWTQNDPVAAPVMTESALSFDGFSKLTVFKIDGVMSPAGCPSQGPA